MKRFWDIKHASFIAFLLLFFLSHSRQSNRSKWLREREYRRTLPYRSRCFPISIQHMAGCVCLQKPYWPFKINDFCLVFWLLLSLKMFSSMLSCVRIFSHCCIFPNPPRPCVCECRRRYWLSPVTVRARVQNHSLEQFIFEVKRKRKLRIITYSFMSFISLAVSLFHTRRVPHHIIALKLDYEIWWEIISHRDGRREGESEQTENRMRLI